MSVSDFPVEDDPEVPAKPRRVRLKGGPIKPGQYLINRVQLKELCGDPSQLHLVGLDDARRLPASDRDGTTRRANHQGVLDRFRSFSWLEARPRRAIGHLKQVRAAQETSKRAASPRRNAATALTEALGKPKASPPKKPFVSKPVRSRPPQAGARR